MWIHKYSMTSLHWFLLWGVVGLADGGGEERKRFFLLFCFYFVFLSLFWSPVWVWKGRPVRVRRSPAAVSSRVWGPICYVTMRRHRRMGRQGPDEQARRPAKIDKNIRNAFEERPADGEKTTIFFVRKRTKMCFFPICCCCDLAFHDFLD